MTEPIAEIEAWGRLLDRYGSVGWPSDWYSKELDGGWAFISPDLPGRFFVVTHGERVGETEPDESVQDAINRYLAE